MRITPYGQSALLLETGSTRLLIDPGSFCEDHVFGITELDAILITHEHPDHCDAARIDALLEANPTAPVFAPAAVIELLGLSGDRVRPVSPGASTQVGDLHIESVGTTHQEILPSIPRCANSGFVITDTDGKRLFHPGDSYETIPPGIDVLAVPLQAPWSSLRKTVDFVQAVAPERIFPIHDGFLNESGRALSWNLLTSAVGPGIGMYAAAEGE